jgi:hypothetical protein
MSPGLSIVIDSVPPATMTSASPDAGHGDGQLGADRHDAADVHALRPLREARADDDVVDARGIQLRSEHELLHAIRGQIVRARDVETTSGGFREASTDAIDDDYFTHDGWSPVERGGSSV